MLRLIREEWKFALAIFVGIILVSLITYWDETNREDEMTVACESFCNGQEFYITEDNHPVGHWNTSQHVSYDTVVTGTEFRCTCQDGRVLE